MFISKGLVTLAAGALLGWPAAAAPALTTIQDVLYKADGTRFSGVAIIEWKSFEAADSSLVPTQLITLQIRNGNLRVQLVPTTNASSGAYYSVRYNSGGKVQFSEVWAVRPSVTPLRLRDVRVGGENNTGTIGQLVSGSGPGFVDSEIPSGTVDGANLAFTLTDKPVPASSLTVYRNGILQKQGLDYTVSSNTITFDAAAVPQAGDILLASYRLTDPNNPSGAAGGALTGTFPNPQISDGAISNSAIAGNAAVVESKLALNYPTHSNAGDPRVLCNGPGTATSSPATTVLGTCLVPSADLTVGGRIEVRFDYSHEGAGTGFAVQLTWGSSTLVSRVAPASEALLAGRAEVAVLDSSVQWNAQSWGASTAATAGAGTATDPLSSPIPVRLYGQMIGTTTDSVTLRNFTVVYYPTR